MQHERRGEGEQEEENRREERGQKRRNVIANELCIVLAPREREDGKQIAFLLLPAASRSRRQVRIFEPPNGAAN